MLFRCSGDFIPTRMNNRKGREGGMNVDHGWRGYHVFTEWDAKDTEFDVDNTGNKTIYRGDVPTATPCHAHKL